MVAYIVSRDFRREVEGRRTITIVPRMACAIMIWLTALVSVTDSIAATQSLVEEGREKTPISATGIYQ